MKIVDIIRQRTHVHYFGRWKLADKGLAGLLKGEIDIKSMQYRQCLDPDCSYKQAELILNNLATWMNTEDVKVGSVLPAPRKTRRIKKS